MQKVETAALASGVRLSYAESGDGAGPALLMVPGPTDSWRSYEQVLGFLPPGIRAVAVSPRGHGDSDKPDSGYGIHDLAGDLVEFMDALGIDRATVVGHSGSSLVARRVAIDHPERVMGLVLEASPTLLSGDKARRFVESVVLELFDPIDEGFVEDFIGDTSSNLARDEFDLLVSETLKVPARVWHALFSELMDYDDIDNLTNISPPTLLIWGDADPLVDREMQDHLTQRIPNSELRVYPGLGHTPRWEDPDRFAADLAAFVTGAHGSG